MTLDPLQLTFDFTTLQCIDEGDGSGDAEPYLWTVFFKIDGETCVVDPSTLKLKGKAVVVGKPGNTNDLGVSEVGAGQTVNIPDAVGRFETTLQPILLKGTAIKFAGVFGAVAVLIESDETPSDAIAKGHAALNSSLQAALDKLIPTFGLQKQAPSDADIKAIEDKVKTDVVNAIASEVGVGDAIGACFTGNCQDDIITVAHFLHGHTELANHVGNPITETWHTTNEGEWKLNTRLAVVKREYDAVWRPGNSGETQFYGMSHDDFEAKNHDLKAKGSHLHLLNTYVERGVRRYDAVWRPSSATDEKYLLGAEYAAYQAKYDELWKQGQRIFLLNTYVQNGKVLYDAVWRPGATGETQFYGMSHDDFKAKYTDLFDKGQRLYLMNTYVTGGGRRYDAVWRPGSGAEKHLFNGTPGDYQAKYDELWKQNYRIVLLNTTIQSHDLTYDAVWRPGTNGEVQFYQQGYSDYQSQYDSLWPKDMRIEILNTYERGE